MSLLKNQFFRGFVMIFLMIIMFFATILGALAFEVDDSEDSFIMSAGEEIQGSFVTDALNPDITTDFPWISVQNTGDFIVDGASSYIYDINVPKEADIGIYRAVIGISDGRQTEYLNVKISVQNKPFAFIFNLFNNPKFMVGFWVILSMILVLFVIYQYVRYING